MIKKKLNLKKTISQLVWLGVFLLTVGWWGGQKGLFSAPGIAQAQTVVANSVSSQTNSALDESAPNQVDSASGGSASSQVSSISDDSAPNQTASIPDDSAPSLDPASTASTSASATTSATTASESAKLAIQEKVDQDLTETVGQVSDDLASFVQSQPPVTLKWYNFIQYSIRQAIAQGLPANLVVLILMFPLVASLIAFARHVIGLKGFGVYAPAVLAVAFVSTGIPLGVLMFVFVIIMAVFIKDLTKNLNLPYLPKTALLIWGISLMVLVLLILAGLFDWQFIIKISIFPLLIIILLSENFMESQLFSNQGTALRLTLETIIIAILGALLISNRTFQEIVILNPELTLILTAVIDILIGRFTGLRLMELWRFKNIARKK